MALQVQVLQEQAKRPAQAARASAEVGGSSLGCSLASRNAIQGTPMPNSPFQGLPMGYVAPPLPVVKSSSAA